MKFISKLLFDASYAPVFSRNVPMIENVESKKKRYFGKKEK